MPGACSRCLAGTAPAVQPPIGGAPVLRRRPLVTRHVQSAGLPLVERPARKRRRIGMEADRRLSVIVEHLVYGPDRDTPALPGRKQRPGQRARTTGPDLRQLPSDNAEVFPRIAVIM